ncbi:hypothetical protein VTI74DRAFT_9026 [Chaetomium olivicolor]
MATTKPRQCWECRRRRLVCDFTRPQCRKCQVRGVACPGYEGNKPLKWLQPQQINSKGPVKMAVALSRPLQPETGREMTAVLEAIEYYNVHIAPDLVATGATGPRSPYFMPRSTAPYLPQAFNESIVCTSLCHRILQSRDAPPSDQLVLARRLQRHRGEALRALTGDLAKPEGQSSDLTLASVLLLLLVEIQQSFEPPNWRQHCNGAAAMMEMRGGLGDLVLSRPYLRHLFRYYALIEIIGATTSPQVDIVWARSQLELVALLPVLLGKGLDTCFPCPPDLLVEIIHINHLRSVFQGFSVPPDTDPTLLKEGRETAALHVLRRIRAFSVDRWATEVAVALSSHERAESRVDLSGWQAIGLIYQSAIAIYCISSLFQDTVSLDAASYNPKDMMHPNSVSPSKHMLAKARQHCASVLFNRLQQVSKTTQLRKLVIWPLVIAGIGAEDDTTKRFVVDELRWISNALGTAVPLVAKDLLENRVWGLSKRDKAWNDLFDQPYVFVL